MTTPPKELVWKFSPFGPFPNQMRHSKSKRLVFLSPPPSKRCVCPLSSPIEGARLLLPQWESPDQTERIWTSLMLIPSGVHISFAYLLFSAKSNLIMSLNVCTLCTTVRLQKEKKKPLCGSELPVLFGRCDTFQNSTGTANFRMYALHK